MVTLLLSAATPSPRLTQSLTRAATCVGPYAPSMPHSRPHTSQLALVAFESRVFDFVDSMATLWIVRAKRSLLRVTDPYPGFSVEALGGTVPVPVTAVGDVGLHLLTAERKWRYNEISGVILVPSATANLYSTQVMYAQHGIRHDFDDACALRLPQRTIPGSHTVEGAADVPFDLVNGAYVLPVIYGPPPRCLPSRGWSLVTCRDTIRWLRLGLGGVVMTRSSQS